MRPQVYVHHNVEPSAQMIVVLRTRDDPAGYASVARAAVHELDRNQPAGRIRTMRDVVSDAVARQRFTMFLAGVFAALALVLSLVGLYAVVSFSVAERTQELGVRFALGATPGSLLGLVLSDGLKLVSVGVGLGLAVAFVLARFLETQLFGVDRPRSRHVRRRADPAVRRRHRRLPDPRPPRHADRPDDRPADAVIEAGTLNRDTQP